MNNDYEIDRDSIGYRVKTLRERENLSQKELAGYVHVTPSQISRLERGETTNVGTDLLVDIAKYFKVSTDYLLGLTPVSSQKNYDISRLGLSTESARRLLSHQIDVDILNRLLEHEKFPYFCTLIRNYFDGDMAGGYMSRNVLMDYGADNLLSMKDNPDINQRELKQDISFIKTSKIGENEADIEKISKTMLSILRDIKKEYPNKRDMPVATAEAIQEIASGLSDIPPEEITADKLALVLALYISRIVPLNEKIFSLIQELAKEILESSKNAMQTED